MFMRACVNKLETCFRQRLIRSKSTFSETESDVGVPLSSGSGYDLNKENLNSLSLSTNSQASNPSASQAATSASVLATKRTRVPAAASKWQEFAKKDKGKSVEPVGGAQFTGFDRDGKGHQMVRPASTASEDSDNETIADPRERARLEKAEACTPAWILPLGRLTMERSVMLDLVLLKCQEAKALLSPYRHMLAERRFQITKPITMMTMETTIIGESSEYDQCQPSPQMDTTETSIVGEVMADQGRNSIVIAGRSGSGGACGGL